MAELGDVLTTNDQRTLGGNIRALRDALGLKQTELADRVGASPANVNRWENDLSKPEFDKLIPLALALETSVERLCEGINPEYDRRRRDRPLPSRYVELWDRAFERHPEAAQTALSLLQVLAGLGAPGGPPPTDEQ